MTIPPNDRLQALLEQLRQDPSLEGNLPGQEGSIVREALAGSSVYEIASQFSMSEAAVWDLLGNAARLATGRTLEPVETGGLGSDTDPGVTGGYGETGFGSLGNEPPVATPEEPVEPSE